MTCTLAFWTAHLCVHTCLTSNKRAWRNRWTNILIKRVYTVIKVFLFKSLFFVALHLFKELCKSCLVIPLPCVLTLKSLSLILGISLDLSLVTIKFWLLKTLSQLQVWSGKVSAYWAKLIISGTSSLWNRVIVFQRDIINWVLCWFDNCFH